MADSEAKSATNSPGNRPSWVKRIGGVPANAFGPDWPWIVAVLLVAFVAAWPALSQPGLMNTRGGGDSPFLLQRLHQLTAALADGHFPARWMPDANYGYGYPFYNYYAPLSIYIAAAFRFLGFTFVRAIHLAQLAGFAVAGLGMFYLGRRWLGSRWAGLLAAIAYIVAPFHMANVYVRGDSLAEFWAMAFYPLVLLAADGLFGERGGGRGAFLWSRPLALFALAYAGLILSHNISALIFSPFLGLYLAVRLLATRSSTGGDRRPPTADRKLQSTGNDVAPLLPRSPAPLLLVLAALALALALAAWFFIPALAEQGLAQLGPVTEGYFHFSNHFRGLDLAQGGLLFDYNPDGGRAFRLGLVQIGLAIAGAAAVLWAGRRRAAHGPFAIGRQESPPWFMIFSALVAVFMITPLSRPLWDHLPLLPFAQFPWRFLSVASCFLALLVGGLVLVTERPAARAAITLTGSLVLLAAGLLGLRVDHLILTDADVTAERLVEYEWFTGNIGTTVSAEYLTPETDPRPWTSAWLNSAGRDRIVALSGELTAELVERSTTSQTWRLTTSDGAEALIPTMQWPGWRATLDGASAELRPYPSSGLMMLAVPAGEHLVSLELGRTPVRLAAEIVSLVAIVVVVILFVYRGRRAKGRSELFQEPDVDRPLVAAQRKRPFRWLWLVAAGLIFLAAAAILWRGDPDELPRGDLTWDFAQMGYLHHSPGGIAFSDGARLYEYGYSADFITAGGTLTVTLSIDPGDGHAATLDLVTSASARPTPDDVAEPPHLAAQTVPLDGDTAIFALPISPDAPAGLYVPRLIIDGVRALTPSGVTRGDLFLRPIRVSAAAGDDRPPSDLGVGVLAITARDATTLDGRFAWSIPRPLGGRYQVSWRAQNGDGVVLSQLDTQPGYGLNPTDGWPAGEQVTDWLALRLPDELSGPAPYPLVMVLYDATSGEQLLLRRVGELVEVAGRPVYQPVTPLFAPPDGLAQFDVTFGDDAPDFINLRGYETARVADVLEIALYWMAMGDIPADYTRFVHLLDASGAVVAQVDGHPAGNSYPTGQWIDGEVITDIARLDLSGLPPGEYRLATGFSRPDEGSARLEAFAADGPLSDGRALLPDSVIIPEPAE